MTRIRRIALGVALALVLLVVGISAGGSRSGSSDESTATTTATETEEPLDTAPTPPDIQTRIFERAFSECATYSVKDLAGKYEVEVESQEQVAAAVGEGWARYFNAGQDAVSDGRDGCLQGFARG